MENIIKKIKEQIETCKQNDESPNESSFNYETGVLITWGEAEKIITELERRQEQVETTSNCDIPDVSTRCTHKVVEWGQFRFKGTWEQCRDWKEQQMNVELDILPINFPVGKP